MIVPLPEWEVYNFRPLTLPHLLGEAGGGRGRGANSLALMISRTPSTFSNTSLFQYLSTSKPCV